MKTLFSRVAVVGLFGLVALALVGDRGAARYAAAQKRATEACRAFRAQPGHEDAEACRFDAFGPSTFKRFNAGEADLEQARAAFARHDPASAGRLLLAVGAVARDMDQRGSFGGALFATRLVGRIVTMIGAYGGEVDGATRRRVLETVRLEAATHPFEDERVSQLWVLANYNEITFAGAPRVSASELTDAMDRDEAAYLAMDEAAVRGDVPRCEAAARTLGRFSKGEYMAGLCTGFAEGVRTRQRVERLLAEADERRP